MVGLAMQRGLISLSVTNIRDYTHDAHGTADDYQFGGGPGMVMKPEPVFEAVEDVVSNLPPGTRTNSEIVLLSPQGRLLDQRLAEELASSSCVGPDLRPLRRSG